MGPIFMSIMQIKSLPLSSLKGQFLPASKSFELKLPASMTIFSAI